MITKAQITTIKSLNTKKGRSLSGLFVAEGVKITEEILLSDLRVRRVYVSGELAHDRMRAMRVLFGVEFADGRIPIEPITNIEMSRISHLKTPTEILIVVEIPTYNMEELTQNLSDLPRESTQLLTLDGVSATSADLSHSSASTPVPTQGQLVLALDGVQDPGNLGTILRMADWFGISDVVCSAESADCFNPKVVQASMGAVARVRVHYTDLPGFVHDVRRAGVPVYGTFLEGQDIYRKPLSASGVIVMGNEGRGISAEVESLVSEKLYIPSFSLGERVESLNVGMATAVICSEFRRRTAR